MQGAGANGSTPSSGPKKDNPVASHRGDGVSADSVAECHAWYSHRASVVDVVAVRLDNFDLRYSWVEGKAHHIIIAGKPDSISLASIVAPNIR